MQFDNSVDSTFVDDTVDVSYDFDLELASQHKPDATFSEVEITSPNTSLSYPDNSAFATAPTMIYRVPNAPSNGYYHPQLSRASQAGLPASASPKKRAGSSCTQYRHSPPAEPIELPISTSQTTFGWSHGYDVYATRIPGSGPSFVNQMFPGPFPPVPESSRHVSQPLLERSMSDRRFPPPFSTHAQHRHPRHQEFNQETRGPGFLRVAAANSPPHQSADSNLLPPVSSLDPTYWGPQAFPGVPDIPSPSRLPPPNSLFVKPDSSDISSHRGYPTPTSTPPPRFSRPASPAFPLTPVQISAYNSPVIPAARTSSPPSPAVREDSDLRDDTPVAASILAEGFKRKQTLLRKLKQEDEDEEDYRDSLEDDANEESDDSDTKKLNGRRRAAHTIEDKRKAHKVIEKRRRQQMNTHFEELKRLMAMEAPAGKSRGIPKGEILAAACKYIDEMNEYCKSLYGINIRMMAERGGTVPDWILTPAAAQGRATDVANGRKKLNTSNVRGKKQREESAHHQVKPQTEPRQALGECFEPVRLNLTASTATTANVKFGPSDTAVGRSASPSL